jgi:hypothetical protein
VEARVIAQAKMQFSHLGSAEENLTKIAQPRKLLLRQVIVLRITALSGPFVDGEVQCFGSRV